MSALIPLVCFFLLLFLRLGWDLPRRCGKGNSPSVSLQLRQSFAVPASSPVGEAARHSPTCSCPAVLRGTTEVEVLWQCSKG